MAGTVESEEQSTFVLLKTRESGRSPIHWSVSAFDERSRTLDLTTPRS